MTGQSSLPGESFYSTTTSISITGIEVTPVPLVHKKTFDSRKQNTFHLLLVRGLLGRKKLPSVYTAFLYFGKDHLLVQTKHLFLTFGKIVSSLKSGTFLNLRTLTSY